MRAFIPAGAPSHSPSKSRVVEAIFAILSNEITSPSKNPPLSVNNKILIKYNMIKAGIMASPTILEKTGLALFQVNDTTLTIW